MKRCIQAIQLPYVRTEERDPEVPNSSKNSLVWERTDQLTFLILNETSKSSSKLNATDRNTFINFKGWRARFHGYSQGMHYSITASHVRRSAFIDIWLRFRKLIMGGIKREEFVWDAVISLNLMWCGRFWGNWFRTILRMGWATAVKNIWTMSECVLVSIKGRRRLNCIF